MKAAEVNQSVDRYPVLQGVQQTHTHKQNGTVEMWPTRDTELWRKSDAEFRLCYRATLQFQSSYDAFLLPVFSSCQLWLDSPIISDTRMMFCHSSVIKNIYFSFTCCFFQLLIAISHIHRTTEDNRGHHMQFNWSLSRSFAP